MQSLLNYQLFSWHFIEHINLCKTHISGLSMEIVDTDFSELFCTCKSVLILASNFNKSIWYDLHNFSSFQRSISKHLPLEQILLRMELHPKERKLFGLYSSHKLLILWRGGRSSQGPERLKQSIGIKSIKRNSPIMIKIHNPITLSKLLFLHPSKSSKQIIVIN